MTESVSGKSVCSGERPAKRRTDYKAAEDMKLDPSRKYQATILKTTRTNPYL